jgi:hypothetical protein
LDRRGVGVNPARGALWSPLPVLASVFHVKRLSVKSACSSVDGHLVLGDALRAPAARGCDLAGPMGVAWL